MIADDTWSLLVGVYLTLAVTTFLIFAADIPNAKTEENRHRLAWIACMAPVWPVVVVWCVWDLIGKAVKR